MVTVFTGFDIVDAWVLVKRRSSFRCFSGLLMVAKLCVRVGIEWTFELGLERIESIHALYFTIITSHLTDIFVTWIV